MKLCLIEGFSLTHIFRCQWHLRAKYLNVRSILMGRVFQRGDSLNVQTELVDVPKVSQLWGAQYNRKLADILTVQEEIATEISDKPRLRLTGAEKRRLTKRYTENTEAYQLYLKGLYYRNRMTEGAFNRGIQYLTQAIEKDPGFAPAHAGLAACYAGLSNLGYLAPKDTFPKAKSAARTALELDENLAEAHAVLANAAFYYFGNLHMVVPHLRRSYLLTCIPGLTAGAIHCRPSGLESSAALLNVAMYIIRYEP